jgi:hypothetical protein
LAGTKELINTIHSSLKEKGHLERGIYAFRTELAQRIVRTLNTEMVSRMVRNLAVLILFLIVNY